MLLFLLDTFVLGWKLTSVFAATNDILRHKQWKHSSLGNCILKIFPYYHVISTQKKHELKRSVSTCTMYKCAIHTNVIKYDKCDYVQNILNLYEKWISPNTVTVKQWPVLYISECWSLHINYGVVVVWSNHTNVVSYGVS